MLTGKRILITGGAGFIGCNAAVDFMRHGDEVTIFDDLSRAVRRRLEVQAILERPGRPGNAKRDHGRAARTKLADGLRDRTIRSRIETVPLKRVGSGGRPPAARSVCQ